MPAANFLCKVNLAGCQFPGGLCHQALCVVNLAGCQQLIFLCTVNLAGCQFAGGLIVVWH